MQAGALPAEHSVVLYELQLRRAERQSALAARLLGREPPLALLGELVVLPLLALLLDLIDLTAKIARNAHVCLQK